MQRETHLISDLFKSLGMNLVADMVLTANDQISLSRYADLLADEARKKNKLHIIKELEFAGFIYA